MERIGGRQQEGTEPSQEPERGEQKERMVEARRISTVFSDPRALEEIADSLLSKGVISGFSVEPIEAGYVFQGKAVKERQYALNILVGEDLPEEKVDMIRGEMERRIGKEWEVPAITEQKVLVNEKLFGFIKRAGVEHKRYLGERRKKLTVASALLVSILGIAGMFAERYIEKRESQAVAAERLKNIDRLAELRQSLDEKVRELDGKIFKRESLTELPSDMAVMAGYEETDDLLKTVEALEKEIKALSDFEKK